MLVPRLLVLSILLSVGVVPLAAQSTPGKNVQPQLAPQSSQPGLRMGPLQDFHLHDTTPTPETSLIKAPETYRNIPSFDRNQVTCYSIRSYRVTRDDPMSDSTKPAGYSTCQPSDRFQVKDAGEPQQILVR